MEKGYMEDGNSGGDEEMIDKMKGEILEIDGQLYFSATVSQILDTISLRPNFMAPRGESNNRILAKMEGTVLGLVWNVPSALTVDITWGITTRVRNQ